MRKRRRVAIVTPTLSGNAVGRAVVFMALLAPDWNITLVGRSFGKRWDHLPLTGNTDVVDLGGSPVPTRRTRSLLKSSVTIAIKPLWSSFGFGLVTRNAAPLLLDIDDPEFSLMTADPRTVIRSFLSLDGVMLPLTNALLSRADARTVASQALQDRFGGTLIPHARDEHLFRGPGTRDRVAARRRLGLELRVPLTVWVGTPRPHKGLDVLLRAAPQLPGKVAIVGASAKGERVLGARVAEIPQNVMLVPPVSYRVAIEWLSAADVVVVPQLDGPIGRLQAPAKLSDALGVGRAVVASDLPPIREIVGDAGILVAPGSAELLASAIVRITTDDALKTTLERSALRRFQEHLAITTVRPRLQRLLEELGA
jgi:glycosyltransferase involved in cell wall biosynthesis